MAVVVTYKPDNDVIKNILQTSTFADLVVIVDNLNTPESNKILNQITVKAKNIQIVANMENEGIAKALNQGAKIALEKKYEWLITLDQDSFVEEGMLKNLFEGFDDYNQKDKDKVLSLSPYYCYLGETEKEYPTYNRFRIIPSTITSGTVMKVECFEKIGYFEEPLFIDCVDDEYFLRMSKAGFKILKIKEAFLEHKLGEKHEYKWFGKTVYSDEHNYIRWYYIMRNNLVIFTRYTFSFPKRNAFSAYMLTKWIAKVIFLESDKYRKLKSIGLGILHFIIGKRGRLDF